MQCPSCLFPLFLQFSGSLKTVKTYHVWLSKRANGSHETSWAAEPRFGVDYGLMDASWLSWFQGPGIILNEVRNGQDYSGLVSEVVFMMARKSGEGMALSIRTSSTKVFGEPTVEPASNHGGWIRVKMFEIFLMLVDSWCLALVSRFRSTQGQRVARGVCEISCVDSISVPTWQKGFKLFGDPRKDDVDMTLFNWTPQSFELTCTISWTFGGVNFFVGPGSKIFCYEMEAHLCVTYVSTTLVGCVGVPPYTGTIVDGC